MAIFYVYILETISKSNRKRFYTGYTNNLERRLNEHKKGTGAKFCRGKRVISLKYFESFTERRNAMRRELEINSLPRREKIKLIKKFYQTEN